MIVKLPVLVFYEDRIYSEAEVETPTALTLARTNRIAGNYDKK